MVLYLALLLLYHLLHYFHLAELFSVMYETVKKKASDLLEVKTQEVEA